MVLVEVVVIFLVVFLIDFEIDINEGEVIKVVDKVVEVVKFFELIVIDMFVGIIVIFEEKKVLDEIFEMVGGMKVGEIIFEVFVDGFIFVIILVKFMNFI